MDARRFTEIKDAIAKLKDQRSRAEGAMDSIVAEWKKSYGVETEEEIEALIAKESKELAEVDESIETAYTELKGLTNWGIV
jgi:hypothetical protein